MCLNLKMCSAQRFGRERYQLQIRSPNSFAGLPDLHRDPVSISQPGRCTLMLPMHKLMLKMKERSDCLVFLLCWMLHQNRQSLPAIYTAVPHI